MSSFAPIARTAVEISNSGFDGFSYAVRVVSW